MAALAKATRKILDGEGLTQVGIFASGDLDEHRIEELLNSGAPIDGFGVGTRMGVAADAPFLNSAYKLVSYAGRSRMKLSQAKATLPGRKQVFRIAEGKTMVKDVVSLHDEQLPGRPLLRPVMVGGKPLPADLDGVEEARRHCMQELAALPEGIRDLAPVERPLPGGAQ